MRVANTSRVQFLKKKSGTLKENIILLTILELNLIIDYNITHMLIK